MKKANVINWLGNYQIEDKKTPLDNEIILHAYGKTWLLELDRDGANALTISPTDYKNKSYNETHSILVFSYQRFAERIESGRENTKHNIRT